MTRRSWSSPTAARSSRRRARRSNGRSRRAGSSASRPISSRCSTIMPPIPDFIRPESRRNEVMRFVEGGLSDLSISRTSFDWGVKVPGSEHHVMYVWLDALTNYLTGVGYPDDSDELPALLAGRRPCHRQGRGALPRRLLAGLPDVGGRGAAQAGVRPRLAAVARREDVEVGRQRRRSARPGPRLRGRPAALFPAARSHLRPGRQLQQRGDRQPRQCRPRQRFGNLAQRTLSFIARNCDGVLPVGGKGDDADEELLATVARATRQELPDHFARLELSQGIEAWLRAVFACNQYIDSQAPWALRKSDPERMTAVLATLYAAIRDLAIVDRPDRPGLGGAAARPDGRAGGRAGPRGARGRGQLRAAGRLGVPARLADPDLSEARAGRRGLEERMRVPRRSSKSRASGLRDCE